MPPLRTFCPQAKTAAGMESRVKADTGPQRQERLPDAERNLGNRFLDRISRAGSGPNSPDDPGKPFFPMIQRKCSTCEMDDGLQTKLEISRPGDVYEREADTVAELVVQRMAAPESFQGLGAPGTPVQRYPEMPAVQRECDECKIPGPDAAEAAEDAAEEAEVDESEPADESGAAEVSPKRETGAPAGIGSSVRDGTESLESGMAASGPGSALPAWIRSDMEGAFGQDFGGVRIHLGSRSNALNRSIRARAFTHGTDVFFNQGQFNPGTREGKRLLAHELTHVVQQTGARAVQPKIRPQIQRAPMRETEPKIGNWAHSLIQSRLREKDDKLITEAPIPGGKRDDKRINVVGFADFYKSDNHTISGVEAEEPQASKDLGDSKKAFYRYKNMRKNLREPDKLRFRQGVQSGTKVNVGPTIDAGSRKWNFTHNFPKAFQIGELKPLFPTEFRRSFIYHGTAATGLIQAGNYRQGFQEFVERAHRDNPAQANIPPTSKGGALTIPDNKIPDAIHYKRFEQERERTTKDSILKNDTGQRIWMYGLKEGIYVYFLLPHPYEPKEFPARADEQLQQLDSRLRKLREKRAKAGNSLMEKADSSHPAPVRPLPARPPAIQRKGEDWRRLGKEWEDDRQNWVKGIGTGIDKPKDFLKKQTKGIKKKAKVDKKLGLKPTGKAGERSKQVMSIRFWSGFRGRVLGALRFRFMDVFDKVEGFFDKVKDKFRKHHAKSGKLVEKNGIFSGWKKVATSTIIRFAVEIFKQMLADAFRGFMNCINGVVEAILGKFTYAVDEAKQDLAKEVEPVCCQLIGFKNEIEGEYRKHEETISAFTGAVETIKEWRAILSNVETAIRVGVQVVSCVTPPGLGCLWGLVAQLGISAGLSLLSRTDYFDEEIAKPAARSLMGAIVGDSLHNFLIDQLEKTPLKPFLDEARDCHRRKSVTGRTQIGGNESKINPHDPEFAKAREAWEKEFGPQILADLQKVFKKANGKKPTKEDFRKLLDLMKETKKTPEELKALMEAARDPASGKLDLEKAGGYVEKGEAPETAPKVRDIDYEKARRVNVQLQKAIGWKPETFHPKPGIGAGTDEFADAVYDLQEALGIEADGIMGENTLIAFYDRNKVKEDGAYKEAVRRRDETREAIAKARREREERKRKAADDKAAKSKPAEAGDKGDSGEDVIMAIPVEKPAPGTPDLGAFPNELHTSPGWIGSFPYARFSPGLGGDKSAYDPGDRLTMDVLYWVRSEKKWIWFTGISVEFIAHSDFNGKPLIQYRMREDHYFKPREGAEGVYVYGQATRSAYTDFESLH